MNEQVKPDSALIARYPKDNERPVGLTPTFGYGGGGGYARQSDYISTCHEEVPLASDRT